MKKIIVAFGFLMSVFVLSGCNTVNGFGEDMSAGGKAISKSADKVQSDL